MGRTFMDAIDDPFAAVDRELEDCRLGWGCDAAIVDMHAEATSEKMAMAHYCDGRASFVVGTHSHVPTADAQILPGGTAYQTDAGACADYDSVIGMEKTRTDHPLRPQNLDRPLQPGPRPRDRLRRLRRNRRHNRPRQTHRTRAHRR